MNRQLLTFLLPFLFTPLNAFASGPPVEELQSGGRCQ